MIVSMVRVRMMDVAIMVAVLGIVGVIVHAVHPLYLTHLGPTVQHLRA
jgi:hypothetical protein